MNEQANGAPAIVVESVHQVRHTRLEIGISILEDHVEINAREFPKAMKFETLKELAELFGKAAALVSEREKQLQVAVPTPSTEPQSVPVQ